MDKNEINRVQELIKRIEKDFPKNKNFEVFLRQLFDKVTNIDKVSFDRTKDICKNETEDLQKYADFNDEKLIEPKKNVNQKLFDESFSKFQKCFQNANKELSEVLQGFDEQLSNNQEMLGECINKCAVNSKSKSDSDIEKCITHCFDSFEGKYESFAKEYYTKFESLENRYIKL